MGPVLANFCPNVNGASLVPQLDQSISSFGTTVYQFALYAVGIAFLVSAAGWAWSTYSNNVMWGQRSKYGTVIAGLAGLLLGAGPSIVNGLFNAGQHAGC